MNSKELFDAIGGIDEKYIEDADMAKSSRKIRVVTFAPRLRWAVTIAACLVVIVGVLLSYNSLRPLTGNQPDNTGNSTIGKPSLEIGEGDNSAALYPAPEEWRGLETESFVLKEQSEILSDRMVFQSLQDLADYSDAFVMVYYVHKVAQDGENIQTAIAEYMNSIGDRIQTRQWDDYTVSTGSRILIRQMLIDGCTMDGSNNLLRVGGAYLLPVRFNSDLGAYEVVGDQDVLFELDSKGKIVSHSQFPELNKYDGKPFSELINAVQALYSKPETEFYEQPIASVEQAQMQINTAYLNCGFRKFTIVFEKETVIKGADVYLFKVTLGQDGKNGSEYGAVAKINGAFIRGNIDTNGQFQTFEGLGGFPKNSK